MSAERPLKIACAVVDYFEFGGMQRTCRRIMEELLRRGHRVVALTDTWDGPVPEGLEVVRFAVRAGTNHGRNKAFARAVVQWREAESADVLVGFNKIPGLDVYYAGDPCFADYQQRRSLSTLRTLLPRYRSMRALESAVFDWGKDTEILMISAVEKSRYQAHYDTEDERLHLLPPGIDRERLDRQLDALPDRRAFLSSLDLDPDDKFIVMVGSGFHTKGVDRVIKALGALGDTLGRFYSLAVVGRGDSGKYKALADRLGLGARVVFPGTRTDIASFLSHADLLCHPARLENTGTALIEAMHCGLPVLTTANCGFAHHVLQAQAGLVCPEPFDQRTFDGMLLSALDAPQRAAWSSNGRAYCRENDLYSLIERAADLICAQRSKA